MNNWVSRFLKEGMLRKIKFVVIAFMLLERSNVIFAETQVPNDGLGISAFEITSERFNASSGKKVLFLAKKGARTYLITITRGKDESVYLNLPLPVDCERIGYELKPHGEGSVLFVARLNSEEGLDAPYVIEQYHLAINHDKEPGVELFSFVKDGERRTRKSYCASKDALNEMDKK